MPVIVSSMESGNNGGRDQSRANVPKQQEQHDDDEQRAFEQVLRRPFRMVRSTQLRSGRRSGEAMTPSGKVLDAASSKRIGDGAAPPSRLFLAHEHKDGAEHDFARRSRFAAPVRNSSPMMTSATSIDPNGDAATIGDDDALEILDAACAWPWLNAPAIVRRSVRHSRRRRLRCWLGQGLDHIIHGETRRGEAIRPRRHMILTN